MECHIVTSKSLNQDDPPMVEYSSCIANISVHNISIYENRHQDIRDQCQSGVRIVLNPLEDANFYVLLC